MAVMRFSGDHVAYFSNMNNHATSTSFTGVNNPFQSTDIIEVEVSSSSVLSSGEFHSSNIDLLRITVIRGGSSWNFQVSSGETVKESGGGSNPEQGDTFFLTNGSIDPPSSGPFSGFPVGEMVFASRDTFTTGATTNIVRQQSFDFNSDGDFSDPGESGNRNFNIHTVCFAAGTMIATSGGEIHVQDLAVGDPVYTLDGVAKPIRKILVHPLSAPFLQDRHKPIEFKKGCFGPDSPKRTLVVSPQHRILLEQADEGPRLVPAKGLIGLPGVRRKRGCKRVEYYHLVFDQHEIIRSDGVWTESFFPGDMALDAVSASSRDEIRDIFGLGQDTPHASTYAGIEKLTVRQAQSQLDRFRMDRTPPRRLN